MFMQTLRKVLFAAYIVFAIQISSVYAESVSYSDSRPFSWDIFVDVTNQSATLPLTAYIEFPTFDETLGILDKVELEVTYSMAGSINAFPGDVPSGMGTGGYVDFNVNFPYSPSSLPTWNYSTSDVPQGQEVEIGNDAGQFNSGMYSYAPGQTESIEYTDNNTLDDFSGPVEKQGLRGTYLVNTFDARVQVIANCQNDFPDDYIENVGSGVFTLTVTYEYTPH